jgi:hypothetical protein
MDYLHGVQGKASQMIRSRRSIHEIVLVLKNDFFCLVLETGK